MQFFQKCKKKKSKSKSKGKIGHGWYGGWYRPRGKGKGKGQGKQVYNIQNEDGGTEDEVWDESNNWGVTPLSFLGIQITEAHKDAGDDEAKHTCGGVISWQILS